MHLRKSGVAVDSLAAILAALGRHAPRMPMQKDKELVDELKLQWEFDPHAHSPITNGTR